MIIDMRNHGTDFALTDHDVDFVIPKPPLDDGCRQNRR
jgi:hypothetical protein